ncbi:MAG: hypothetical protein MUF49_02130 [Oculatellaceae cyanobacterium Prado106]|nr:hypothetical protein [Oculatellaceae cyanobacterium Prado106]
MPKRLAKRRAEALQPLIVFQMRQESFALLIQCAQKVIPLGTVYGTPEGGIRLTRYQNREIPVIDIESRIFTTPRPNPVQLEASRISPTDTNGYMNGYTNGYTNGGRNESTVDAVDVLPQPHLLIVDNLQGDPIGIPLPSPPTLRRVPIAAFAPLPALYLSNSPIRCISALVHTNETEPPFFLLNLDQICQGQWALGTTLPAFLPQIVGGVS